MSSTRTMRIAESALTLLLACAATVGSANAAEMASATITATPLGAGIFKYDIRLNNTGTSNIGTFWFAWVPGADFMPVSPTNILSPNGWSPMITNAGPSDGFAILWTASASAAQILPGGSLPGYEFQSTMTPAQLAGFSSYHATYLVETSFVYSGMPFSDPGFQFVASLASSALGFVPTTPCRLLDTRQAPGTFGGPFIGPSGADGQIRSFTIPNSVCSIPQTAQAYSLNVTVIPHGALGYIAVWPTGQNQPLVSTLNSYDGRVKANAAVVPAGTGGAISVFATNDTDVILDINGYFVPASTSGALAFYPLPPCRVVDTRINLLSSGALSGGTSRTLPILSSSCNVPVSAQAYSFNFTAVPSRALGYLSVWPTGQSQPLVSTLNDLTGTVAANAAIVPTGAAGSIDVFATDTTDLIVDIDGYFAPAATGGLSLYNLSPCRVLDTRNPSGSPPFTGSLNVNVIGSACGGTSAAQGYVLNATVLPTMLLGYLTLWSQGTVQPTVSTLNALDGAITNNMAIVPTSNGEISAYATNSTQLILDVFGYFGP